MGDHLIVQTYRSAERTECPAAPLQCCLTLPGHSLQHAVISQQSRTFAAQETDAALNHRSRMGCKTYHAGSWGSLHKRSPTACS